jgi:hypothetical protein
LKYTFEVTVELPITLTTEDSAAREFELMNALLETAKDFDIDAGVRVANSTAMEARSEEA